MLLERPSPFASALLITFATFAIAPACNVGSDCDFGLCAAAQDAGLSASDASGVQTPPDCKEDADAKSPEAKGCVVDAFAVFVDAATGVDTNDGSKARPLKTITAAIKGAQLAAKRRIYLCGHGPYREQVELKESISLFGGLSCGSWNYDGTKARIEGPVHGYALHVNAVQTPIVVSDFELVAPDANSAKDGSSSIAAFVNRSTLKLVRVTLRAGTGAAGADGAAGRTGVVKTVSKGTLDLNGINANGTTPGGLKDCICDAGPEKTTGGIGGASGSGGGPGRPDLGGAPPNDGHEGAGSVVCNPNGFGHNGAPAPAANSAPAITSVGDLSTDGWRARSGSDATETGSPGQGGGGGGSRDGSSAGGGGGCGGCGGTPGKGGQGGGASIALLSNESAITILGSTLFAGAGGKGGAGGVGGAGGQGGTGGIGNCSGGEGGRGGDGGGGGGGAGGVSIGLLYKGAAPELDVDTQNAISVGTRGLGGIGGKPSANDGPNGVAAKIKDSGDL